MNTDPLPAMGAEKGGQKFPPIYDGHNWPNLCLMKLSAHHPPSATVGKQHL